MSRVLDTVQGRRAGHGSALAGALVRRLAAGVAALFVTTMLIFAAINILPGDVAMVVLAEDATPAKLEAIRSSLKLDTPIAERYVQWLSGMLRGELGESTAWLARGEHLAIRDLIAEPLKNSAILVAVTIVVFVPLSILVGTLSALNAGRPLDHGIAFFSLTLSALPDFLTGTMLVLVFFYWLDWLPPTTSFQAGQSPFSDPLALILPIVTMVGTCLAFGSRLIRASVLEALAQDYVTWARLYGLSGWRIVVRYALRNALAPGIQGLALVIRAMIGGLIIAESLFDYPGIGGELSAAVTDRDVQLVAVITTLLAAVYIGVNLLADIAVIALNPRLRGRPS